METSRFIFDMPNAPSLSHEMIKHALTFWAMELSDRNQYINPDQEKFLRKAYRADDRMLEDVNNVVLDILEYSGMMMVLVNGQNILNEVHCRLDNNFGEVILEWL